MYIRVDSKYDDLMTYDKYSDEIIDHGNAIEELFRELAFDVHDIGGDVIDEAELKIAVRFGYEIYEVYANGDSFAALRKLLGL